MKIFKITDCVLMKSMVLCLIWNKVLIAHPSKQNELFYNIFLLISHTFTWVNTNYGSNDEFSLNSFGDGASLRNQANHGNLLISPLWISYTIVTCINYTVLSEIAINSSCNNTIWLGSVFLLTRPLSRTVDCKMLISDTICVVHPQVSI